MNDYVLNDDQKQLLMAMVEAQRNVPKSQRSPFIYSSTHDGSSIIHNGFAGGNYSVYKGDLDSLAELGLLRPDIGSRGSPLYHITPQGERYYAELMQSMDETAENIEQHVQNYLQFDNFPMKYPDAHSRWSEAEKILWDSKDDQEFTTIGHLCREAVQQFVSRLISEVNPPAYNQDITKTKNRFHAVIEYKKKTIGKASRSFLKALFEYWVALNDLIQRQEHGAQKEGEPLQWEDARKVVFHTGILMYEIDRALFK